MHLVICLFLIVLFLLSASTTTVFNVSLAKLTFLLAWKTSQETSTLKKGNRMILANYHLISLLPLQSKVIEHAISK